MLYSLQNHQHLGWCSDVISVMNALISSSDKVDKSHPLGLTEKMRLGEG